MQRDFRGYNRASRRKPGVAPLTAALGVAAGLIGLWHPAFAGQDANGLTIFRGDSSQVSGITPSGWGSGTILEDTQVVYNGSESFKIVTHGLYQGANLALAKPADFGPYIANKNAYLEVAIMPPPKDALNRGGGGFPGGQSSGGFPGGFPGFGGRGGRGGFPGGAGGAAGGQGGPGNAGRNNNNTPRFQKAKAMENVRLVLATSTGKNLEVLMPMSYAADDGQWKLLHIPVAAIPGITAEDAQVTAVRVFADQPGTIHLGLIRIKTDATPLSILPMEEKVVPRNDRYRYTVSANGGSTALVYSWDFDASDGIQDESQGRSVIHAYRKPGDYTVTVTLSDYYGIKPPATMKFKVHVTP